MIGQDGVLLETSEVFVEAVAALVVEAVAAAAAVVAHAVVVVEVGGGPSLGDVDHVAAALPPQGGLAAGRGHRLAVRAAVAAGGRPLHRGHPDGGDGLRVGVEGRREGGGGGKLHVGVGAVGVKVGVNVVKVGVVGVEAGVLEIVGVVWM